VSSKRSKAGEEEVKTREGHKVDSELTKILIELTRETKRASDTRHDLGHKAVKVAVAGSLHAEGAGADVVQCLVIDAVGLIAVIDKLMDRKSAVVGLNNSVRNLGARNDREGGKNTIRILLLDLAKQQGTHTRAGTTTKTVGKLEALKTFTGLSFFTDNIHNAVYKGGTLSVVTLSPAVCGTVLTVDEVIRTIDLTIRTGTKRFKSSRLKIKTNCTRNKSIASSFVEVNI